MNETLIALLSDATGIDKAEITPELSRHEDDRWDSLNHLRLITALEEVFFELASRWMKSKIRERSG